MCCGDVPLARNRLANLQPCYRWGRRGFGRKGQERPVRLFATLGATPKTTQDRDGVMLHAEHDVAGGVRNDAVTGPTKKETRYPLARGGSAEPAP